MSKLLQSVSERIKFAVRGIGNKHNICVKKVAYPIPGRRSVYKEKGLLTLKDCLTPLLSAMFSPCVLSPSIII